MGAVFAAYRPVRLFSLFFRSKVVGCGLYRSELYSPEFTVHIDKEREQVEIKHIC